MPEAKADRLDRAQQKLSQAVARLEVAQGRARARKKRAEATRRYWLGVVLERFLFDEPALLAEMERSMRSESPRVREAFGLDRPPSWFAQPAKNDPKKAVDTRRYRLGMALERLLRGNVALITRVEALMRAQAPYVRDAFGMEGVSWFDELRAMPVPREHGRGAPPAAGSERIPSRGAAPRALLASAPRSHA